MPPRPTAATRPWSRACRSWRWWLERSLTANFRHCERNEAIQSRGRDSGLLRYARNDGEAEPRLFLQILLHLRAQTVAQIGARHAVGDVGAQEARLGAAIVPLTLKFDAVELLRFSQTDHGVRELDLAAGAALLGLENLEDLRLQDVAPGDRQVRRRGSLWRLLHHAVDLEQVRGDALADTADAVLMGEMIGHALDREQIGFFAELACGIDHLLQATRRVEHQFVRQHDGKGFIADDVARTPHRVA